MVGAGAIPDVYSTFNGLILQMTRTRGLTLLFLSVATLRRIHDEHTRIHDTVTPQHMRTWVVHSSHQNTRPV